MLFLTRWFGVTSSDAERNLGAEPARIEEIVEKSLCFRLNPPNNNIGRSAVELTSRASAPVPNLKFWTLPLDATQGWRRA